MGRQGDGLGLFPPESRVGRTVTARGPMDGSGDERINMARQHHIRNRIAGAWITVLPAED